MFYAGYKISLILSLTQQILYFEKLFEVRSILGVDQKSSTSQKNLVILLYENNFEYLKFRFQYLTSAKIVLKLF